MTAKLLLPAQFVEEIEPVRRVKILSSPNFSMIHEWCLGFTGHLSAQLVQEEPVALRKEDEDSVWEERRANATPLKGHFLLFFKKTVTIKGYSKVLEVMDMFITLTG